MTNIIATALQAPAVTNLQARGDTAGTGVYLQWSTPSNDLLWSTEVWYSTTNDRASAALYKTVLGNDTIFVGTPGQTYYFWIRSVSVYGKANGAWYPSDIYSGVASRVNKVTLNDIESNSLYLNYFHDSLSSVQGAGGANYAGVASISISNNSNNLFLMIYSFSCIQRYTGAAVTTKWMLKNTTTGQVIKDFGQFDDKVNNLALASTIFISPNATETITLFWWGANNTVSRSHMIIQILGLR